MLGQFTEVLINAIVDVKYITNSDIKFTKSDHFL